MNYSGAYLGDVACFDFYDLNVHGSCQGPRSLKR